jgi:hypothetical protein
MIVSAIIVGLLFALKIYWPITEPEHVEALSTAILGFILSAIIHWYISITQ